MMCLEYRLLLNVKKKLFLTCSQSIHSFFCCFVYCINKSGFRKTIFANPQGRAEDLCFWEHFATSDPEWSPGEGMCPSPWQEKFWFCNLLKHVFRSLFGTFFGNFFGGTVPPQNHWGGTIPLSLLCTPIPSPYPPKLHP